MTEVWFGVTLTYHEYSNKLGLNTTKLDFSAIVYVYFLSTMHRASAQGKIYI